MPQKVWWNARFPKDEFDERSLRTFDNLQKAGLITVTGGPTPDGAAYVAHVTQKGFPILGTAPSARGPVFRGLICYKTYDGLRNFQRHPTEPTIGHGELAWRYTRPTPLYPAVRDEAEQAARQTVRVAGVVLLQGPPVAVRRDGAEDRAGVSGRP